MTQRLHGIIHGNRIELNDPPHFADGVEVEVVIHPTKPKRQPGEGFLRTEGALADDTEWDTIMEEVQQSRKLERTSQWESE
jgi:hypothetical protein